MLRSALMAVTLAAATQAAASPGPITAMDLLNLRQITSVDVAPDGAFAVYTLKTIAREGEDEKGLEKYDYHTNLWMVRLDEPGAEPVQLTFGDRDDTSPAISPDGARVVFVRQPRKPDGEKERPKPQVWSLPTAAPGEAQQITALEFGATSPKWRPDGAALLVTSAIPSSKIEGKPGWKTERPARRWRDAQIPDPKKETDADAIDAKLNGDRSSIRNWLARNASKQNPVVLNRLAFQEEHGLKGEEKFSHLFLVDLEKNNATTQITHGFHDHADASFSPDGRRIAFVAKPRTGEHPDRILRTAVFVMNADGSRERARLDDEGWSYDSPRFTRDGRDLVFTATRQDEPLYRQARLGRAGVRSGETTGLASEWGSAQNAPVVTDRGVYFTSPWRGGFPLLVQSFSGSEEDPTPVFSGALGVQTFDAAGGRVVAAVTTPANPSELFVVDRVGETPRQLTHHNEEWLKDRVLSTPTEHWITRPDGVRVQYWVMEPTHRKPGKKYPIALEIHGGPMAMWGPGEFSMWHEFQMLAAWGYGVVYSNPRGSSGYGFEFQRGNHMNWGEAPTGDVLGALDDAIAHNDWLDKDRQVVTGGSYAGYLTAWIIGHTDRFRAAVAQRGVYDITTFFGEGNAWMLVQYAMGGFPWQPATKAVLDRESPFTYVDHINTPFLIIHGSSDLRTGVAESEMMYRALKELKKPVEYVRYPGAGHDLSREGDPLQRLDRLLRIVEFFERYSGNDRPAPGSDG